MAAITRDVRLKAIEMLTTGATEEELLKEFEFESKRQLSTLFSHLKHADKYTIQEEGVYKILGYEEYEEWMEKTKQTKLSEKGTKTVKPPKNMNNQRVRLRKALNSKAELRSKTKAMLDKDPSDMVRILKFNIASMQYDLAATLLDRFKAQVARALKFDSIERVDEEEDLDSFLNVAGELDETEED